AGAGRAFERGTVRRIIEVHGEGFARLGYVIVRDRYVDHALALAVGERLHARSEVGVVVAGAGGIPARRPGHVGGAGRASAAHDPDLHHAAVLTAAVAARREAEAPRRR